MQGKITPRGADLRALEAHAREDHSQGCICWEGRIDIHLLEGWEVCGWLAKSEEEGLLGREDIKKNTEMGKAQAGTSGSEVKLSRTQDLWLRVIRDKAGKTSYPHSSSLLRLKTKGVIIFSRAHVALLLLYVSCDSPINPIFHILFIKSSWMWINMKMHV